MNERKWEDLEFDCLVNILRRVGIKSLLLVPLVCKSWHEASLDPSCWEHIDFPYFDGNILSFVRSFMKIYQLKSFSIFGLIKLIVACGLGKSTSLVLGQLGSEKVLEHVAEKCPELKSLSLKGFVHFNSDFPKFIEKWERLEEVRLVESTIILPSLVAEIGHSCKNFSSLAVCCGIIRKEHALAIALHLPKITNLSLLDCLIEQEDLEIILSTCKDLALLDVNRCRFRGIWEEEKLKYLAAHVKTVNLDAFSMSGISNHDN